MRRLLRWVIGLLSALALWRAWSRRRRERDAVEPEPDPADELRRKLAETRDEEPPAAPDAAESPVESLEERRARVHAKAEEAIDAMHGDET